MQIPNAEFSGITVLSFLQSSSHRTSTLTTKSLLYIPGQPFGQSGLVGRARPSDCIVSVGTLDPSHRGHFSTYQVETAVQRIINECERIGKVWGGQVPLLSDDKFIANVVGVKLDGLIGGDAERLQLTGGTFLNLSLAVNEISR